MFSVFDPQSLLGLSMNWVSSLLVILTIFTSFWIAKNKINILLSIILKQLHQEFSAIFGATNFPGATFMTVCLFMNIMINNLFGLFPYIFTSSAHGTFTLTLAIPLWIGHMFMAMSLNFEASMSHFVPLNTPTVLMPFMATIELVSSIIRPLTLAIRLAANMIAGHLLLALLSEKMVAANLGVIIAALSPLLALIVLELAVAVIQGYVFALLSTLYLEEVSTKKFV